MTEQLHPKRRTYQFTCDECGETVDTEEEDFGNAVGVVKRQGWRPKLVDGEWHHYCGDCRK